MTPKNLMTFVIISMKMLFLLIHLCISQDDLPVKYTTVGTSSCIQYQPFVFGQNLITVQFNSVTLCTFAVISGKLSTIITESYKDRLNCTVDRVTNDVKFCYNSIMKSDAGIYTITLFVSTPQSKNGTVYVMDMPTTPTITPTSAEELQQVTLTCTSSSTSAPTGLAMSYTWTVDRSVPADADQRYSVSSNLLIIQTAQRGDKDRVFQCVATEDNGLSSDRTDVMLTVTYRPVVSTSGNVTTVEGTRSQISCNVLDANPSTIERYNWYKDTNPSAILTTNHKLTLTSTNRQDYGVYSCTAVNNVGMSITPASAAVIVQFGPDSVNLSGDTTLNENTALTLMCNAALSNPQPTLSWYTNGAVITVNSQLTTTDGQYGGKTTHQVYSTVIRKQDHRTNITCVATNTAGTSFGSVILNIRYKPIIEAQPANQVVIEGNQNVVFRCVVTDANPSPDSYSWRKGGSSISNNQNYTIQNVRRSDLGSYNCTSTNIAGTSAQATATLAVLYPPEIADIAKQTPEEGTTLSVTCTITTSNPAPNRIYWTRSKDSTFKQNSSVLTIPNISRSHTDTYTCHAENIMSPSSGSSVVGSDEKQVMVDVHYGPGNSVHFDPVSSTISMEENNTRSIPTVRCLAECNPPCQYSWTGNTGSSNATLNLGTATRDKNGTYTCTASNIIGANKGESQTELTIFIFYRALVTSFTIQGGAIHNEHSHVSLTCAIDSYPVSQVLWTSTGERQNFTQQGNPNSTFVLSNVSCSDTANYTCSAYNGYGVSSVKTATLFVKCTPRLPLNEEKIKYVGVGNGENLSISSTYIAYPKPSVTWFFNSTSTNTSKQIDTQPVEQIGLNMFRSNLVRELKDGKDIGEYRSVAQNDAGNEKGQQVFNVVAKRQPNEATNLVVSCQSSSTANISWTVGFNGGLQQWFNVMYRPFTSDTYIADANVSHTEKEQRKSYVVFTLSASTKYLFKVKSSNSIGSMLSKEIVNCTTLSFEEEGGSSSALVGGVAGASAAIFLIVIVIVGIFLFRRVQGKKHGDSKELSERPLALMNEVPDGIKDNILYESAGDNFNQPRQDVYAEVVKPKKKAAAVKTNDVYAEVQKPKKSNNKKKLKGNDNKLMADVYENVGEIKGAAKEQEGKPAERGYRNEDGLLYVDVDIKPSTDGRRNVIIGEEERTDYASVDFVVPQ